MATNKKPAQTLRCGNIKATIWKNSGENGQFYSTTFTRPFRDASGVWHNAASFGVNELELVLSLASQAKDWIGGRMAKK
jgi:hypothetical protein